MALSSFVGSITQPTTTGNQSYTGVGFQPKAIIFFGNQKTANGDSANTNSFFGVATSSTDRRVTSAEYKDNSATSASANANTGSLCIQVIDNAATVKSAADFVTMDIDGFTVNWTVADTTQRIVNYIALGGGDLTNAITGAHKNISTGNEGITGVGFRPDAVIFFMHQVTTVDPNLSTGNVTASLGFATSSANRAYNGNREVNGVALSVARRKQINTAAFGSLSNTGVQDEFDLVSMDIDGFTVNYSTSGLHYFYFLALKGGQYKVGTFNQATSTGNQAVSNIGFQPSGVILTSINEATSTTQDANARWSLGAASSSVARAGIWRGSTDNSATTDADQDLSQIAVIRTLTEGLLGSPTLNTVADFVSNDSGGFTINNTTADATAREIIYLAFGSNTASSSFTFTNTKLKALNLLGVGT